MRRNHDVDSARSYEMWMEVLSTRTSISEMCVIGDCHFMSNRVEGRSRTGAMW